MSLTTYLFDTDVLIAYLRNYEETIELLQGLAEAGHTLATTSVTVVEIEAGIRPAEEEATRALLDNLTVYQLDYPTARLAGKYIRQHRQQGTTLGLADAIIAATTISHQLILITYNPRHYPMPEIKLHSVTTRL